ncbi:MAG TPA: ABC transporter ATP-binding protein [Desulfosalsimonadaceae bacterium]|nr:ABC transporter ATP-binding protein [Desulfosalsimonadaceae bacterium]
MAKNGKMSKPPKNVSPETGGPLIRLQGISKQFQNSGTAIEILNNLCFDIYAGETIAILGESGIGKSTFLHVLGTLEPPDQGEIIYSGTDISRFDSARLAGFRNSIMGFVFQFHYLLEEFTALENVMMPGLIKRLKRNDIRDAAESILTRVGLSHRLHHQVSQLSGGEQQRVALARALVLQPDILLADEPTGNLDKKNSRQIHDLLLELNKEFGMTIVVVTHNLHLADYMNRQLTLAEGKLVDLK